MIDANSDELPPPIYSIDNNNSNNIISPSISFNSARSKSGKSSLEKLFAYSNKRACDIDVQTDLLFNENNNNGKHSNDLNRTSSIPTWKLDTNASHNNSITAN